MLPAITSHCAHIMFFCECMLIVCIKIQQGVALFLLGIIIQSRSILLIAGVHHARQIRNILCILAFQDIIA